MRLALVSVFAIAAAVGSAPALAQETTPPPAPAVEPAAPAPAPAVQVPAAPAPAAVAAAPAEPEPATLPPTPNDPMTLRVLQVLDTICTPMVQGGDLEALAKPLRFRERRDVYTLKVSRYETITLRPPGPNNANVCFIELDHALGGDKDITVGLHNWAITRGYQLYRNDEFTTDMKRHTRSWELNEDGKQAAMVFVTTRKADGSPLNRRADRSTVMFTVQ